MSEQKFNGKVAVVTGATSGIGRACALGFANEGAKVVCVGRNEDALNTIVQELRTAGAEIAGGVYNNITSLQRNTLGYASYDQYYGPDDRAKGSSKPR